MTNGFIIQKPNNFRLKNLVDYYFYLDIPVSDLIQKEEYVLPFPRITFGYFFEYPFRVTNLDTSESVCADMIISRISTTKISVIPTTDRVKIIGAHVRPYTLAHLTDLHISKMPWLINTIDVFGQVAGDFKNRINECATPREMFDEVEKVFLKTLLIKDLSLIITAVDTIESHQGNISIAQLSDQLEVSSRTLQNHFRKSLGCAPKDYIHLVKLKQAIFQMHYSSDSLTAVSYDQHFADQAHFTNTFKSITGSSPKKLRAKMTDFRFLQF